MNLPPVRHMPLSKALPPRGFKSREEFDKFRKFWIEGGVWKQDNETRARALTKIVESRYDSLPHETKRALGLFVNKQNDMKKFRTHIKMLVDKGKDMELFQPVLESLRGDKDRKMIGYGIMIALRDRALADSKAKLPERFTREYFDPLFYESRLPRRSRMAKAKAVRIRRNIERCVNSMAGGTQIRDKAAPETRVDKKFYEQLARPPSRLMAALEKKKLKKAP